MVPYLLSQNVVEVKILHIALFLTTIALILQATVRTLLGILSIAKILPATTQKTIGLASIVAHQLFLNHQLSKKKFWMMRTIALS
jgi:hypothetical protein